MLPKKRDDLIWQPYAALILNDFEGVQDSNGDKVSVSVFDLGLNMLSNFPGMDFMEVKPGSVTKPVAGYELQILNEQGEIANANEEGYVAVKLPLPPGCLPSLWKNTDGFKSSYLERFPGYYFSGDGGFKDSDGFTYITGRVDDIINVAGHRLSTVEMEEVVAAHPSVAECAVIGANDSLKGQIPLAMSSVRGAQSEKLTVSKSSAAFITVVVMQSKLQNY